MSRPDQRAADEPRPITVEIGIQHNPEGSVLYRCGGTAVLVSASIDDGADYWRLGTEGNGGADENRFVNGSLVSSRLHVRKGLPFGIEIGLEGGHFYDSSLWVWGADLKIAILEGFREGWQAILPDIAVRGTVRSLAGARDLQLTVPSFDVIVSKRLVLGKVLELTPMVAAQFFWIAADSEVVDLTPGTDAYAACDPVATPDPESPPLACQGDTSDLANNRSFDELRAFRSRLALGLSGRYRYLSLGVTFHIDLLDPSNADDDVPDELVRSEQPAGDGERWGGHRCPQHAGAGAGGRGADGAWLQMRARCASLLRD